MKFGFTTISTKKFDESLGFYRDILGFTVEKQFEPNPGVSIAFLEKDGNRIELIQNPMGPPVDNSKSSVVLTFIVDDAEVEWTGLERKSIGKLTEVMTLPNGMKIFHAEDPNGVSLGFVQEPV